MDRRFRTAQRFRQAFFEEGGRKIKETKKKPANRKRPLVFQKIPGSKNQGEIVEYL